jgi:hypothetical protein
MSTTALRDERRLYFQPRDCGIFWYDPDQTNSPKKGETVLGLRLLTFLGGGSIGRSLIVGGNLVHDRLLLSLG